MIIQYKINQRTICHLGYQFDHKAHIIEFLGFEMTDEKNALYFKLELKDDTVMIPLIGYRWEIVQPFSNDYGQFFGQLVEISPENTIIKNSETFKCYFRKSIKIDGGYEVHDPELDLVYTEMKKIYEKFKDIIENGGIGEGGGIVGKDGKSAYELAVENGFTGTLQEWLASLHGADGEDGATGQKGDTGASGADGQNGFSPQVTVTEIEGGHKVSITDAEGTKEFDVMDGTGGSGGDIQQATETVLGGVKAKNRTTEMGRVTIDDKTGELFTGGYTFITEIELTEDVDTIVIDKDLNGNDFKCNEIVCLIMIGSYSTNKVVTVIPNSLWGPFEYLTVSVSNEYFKRTALKFYQEKTYFFGYDVNPAADGFPSYYSKIGVTKTEYLKNVKFSGTIKSGTKIALLGK